ncbi:MAG: M28 family peptidase [Methanomassiliicoccales archaeon]|nr:MAG: M28 family peptidase [Methanomassiliicoccales archaeon]
MKKNLKLLTILVVLILLFSFIALYSVSKYSQGYRMVGFDCDEAYKDMVYLTELGPRVPGTEEDLKGAEYVKSRFSEAGLSDVNIEEHTLTTFEVNSASLSLVTFELGRQIYKTYEHIKDFVLYQYSGSTNGDLTLEIVDVGNGSEEAFAQVDVEGRAVISTEQALPRAAEHGANAVIVRNTRLGEELGYPPYSGGLYGSDENGDNIPYPDAHPDAVVPTCSVSRDVGDEMIDAIENARVSPLLGIGTVWIRMNFDTSMDKNEIYNVVGDVKGESHPEEIIYIVAHRDTTYINCGAVDNTVGTVTIMEMARQLAQYEVHRTIRFISVDAEEKGLLGAIEYVKAHEEEVKKHGIICMNFDMNDVNLKRVDTLEVRISNWAYNEKLKEIRTMMYDTEPDLKEKYKINITEGGGGPDAAPFFKRGIDASFAMGEWGSSLEYHTQWDTIEHVNKESWQISGILFGTLALDIAGLL